MIDVKNVREGILKEAIDAVNGSREEDYGDAEDNFHRIAGLWSTYMASKWVNQSADFNPLRWFSAVDVANMLILLKIARTLTGTGKRDNWVDIAGYAACAAGIEAAKALHDE